ncbi:MAG: hypothetical protein AB1918_11400 [Pseudomonadota bacterium]
MRGENLLFLPRAGGYRITDEYRQRTYGTIAVEAVEPCAPARPGRVHCPDRFVLAIDLGGGMAMREEFVDLGHAQDRAEAYLRSHGALG